MKLIPKYTAWEAISAALAIGTKALQEVRDLARQPGPPGQDGVGFDDMTFETREDGCYLVWEKGDVVKEARLPIPMDRGVYKEGVVYYPGDGVTWAGSFHIAQQKTSAKPETAASGWRLAVKRGRDGKDSTPTKPEKPKA
jgi:collagen type III alpha